MRRAVAGLKQRLGDEVTAFKDVFRDADLAAQLGWALVVLGHWP